MEEGTMTAFSTATTDRQASAEPLVLRRDRDGVATLTLNRPEARNALSSALMSELHDLLDQIADDGHVKVVVIAGPVPAFSSCHSLTDLRPQPSRSPPTHRKSSEALFPPFSRLLFLFPPF